jgi:predicted aminopeptidase
MWRSKAVRYGVLALLVVAAASAGCSHIGYYWQAAQGQLEMRQAARPVAEVLADPATDARLKIRLELTQQIRSYASRELGLPDNRSYTLYADLKRPAVLWNVFATPELSMQLKQWCFPVAGCVTYEGFFKEARAQEEAASLRAEGLEAFVGPVPAYSTLGWFDDPLLNTFIWYPEGELARLIFHELAHQLLYVKGDSTFNESFATAVEEFGVQRWMAEQTDPALRQRYALFASRKADFQALLTHHRIALESAYADPGNADDVAKRAAKHKVFEALRADYETLKRERWSGFAGYDRWFTQPLTNAHLASFGTYTEWLPAFRALLAQQGGDIRRFYAEVQALAALPKEARDARLKALAPTDGPTTVSRPTGS